MTKEKAIKEEKEWDKYWTRKKTFSQGVYRKIASFYRNHIIKKNLNKFVGLEFEKGDSLLHAGSGSGQVDKDIIKNYNLTALDISSQALKLYKFYNGEKAKTLKASIFEIPVQKETYDGIYNLGVHEHFTGAENQKILEEFSRVLKPDGKILLFWPPKYGFSVIFLNSLHFFLNELLRKKIRLHPDEISLIESKRQVNELLKDSGFKMVRFYFGPSDLFTHCIITAKKITRK
jgi:ubiquinone/menaquinone biosynthesis C-methylase UbiE